MYRVEKNVMLRMKDQGTFFPLVTDDGDVTRNKIDQPNLVTDLLSNHRKCIISLQSKFNSRQLLPIAFERFPTMDEINKSAVRQLMAIPKEEFSDYFEKRKKR